MEKHISVEPLIEHIKDVFKIDPLPIRGYHKATGIVLLSVLLYQIIVYTILTEKKEKGLLYGINLGLEIT